MVNKFKFYYEYMLIGATRTNMLEHPDPGLNLPVYVAVRCEDPETRSLLIYARLVLPESMEVEVGKIKFVCFGSKWQLSRYMNGGKLTHPCWLTLSWGRNQLSRKVYGVPCARTRITGQLIVLYNPCSHRAQVTETIGDYLKPLETT